MDSHSNLVCLVCRTVVMFKIRALNVCLFTTCHMIDNVYSMLTIKITDRSQT